jgi:hypothetical protein
MLWWHILLDWSSRLVVLLLLLWRSNVSNRLLLDLNVLLLWNHLRSILHRLLSKLFDLLNWLLLNISFLSWSRLSNCCLLLLRSTDHLWS